MGGGAVTPNIFSGSRDLNGLCAALTNPTLLATRKGTIQGAYPVDFQGVRYPDAESAYQDLKAGVGWGDETGALTDDLMANIIAAKLEQHPRLFYRVRDLGGLQWIATCRHMTFAQTARFRSWEGQGWASRFIRNLATGYAIAAVRFARKLSSQL